VIVVVHFCLLLNFAYYCCCNFCYCWNWDCSVNDYEWVLEL